jgi:hypothetical protein
MFFKRENEISLSESSILRTSTKNDEGATDTLFYPLRCSVSYVRPSFSNRSEPVSKEDVNHWRQRQYSEGRYVIDDSHFRIGGFLRSVPKLGHPDSSELMKSRIAAKELDKKRSELGLPELVTYTE